MQRFTLVFVIWLVFEISPAKQSKADVFFLLSLIVLTLGSVRMM